MLGHRLVIDESLMTTNVRVSPSVVSPLVFLVVLRSALPSSCNCAVATFSPLDKQLHFTLMVLLDVMGGSNVRLSLSLFLLWSLFLAHSFSRVAGWNPKGKGLYSHNPEQRG
ncbi:MAG: hypothetical protein J3Q66DRAFT_17440 [Benniella sp.]|nr:MAG: hypothetical protein J3Q66DRAFT_17440 [Benniella sp.]